MYYAEDESSDFVHVGPDDRYIQKHCISQLEMQMKEV